MTVTHAGSAVGSWAIGHGMADTPTPVGETFLLASFTDRNQSYSPVIFATGSHSDTLDGYGGGPGHGGGARLADPVRPARRGVARLRARARRGAGAVPQAAPGHPDLHHLLDP